MAKSSPTYSDVAYVNGVYARQPVYQEALYWHCHDYFFEHYSRMFFVDNSRAEDMFQESFITLWQNIEHRKIYVQNDIIIGKGGKPFSGTLNTYLMGIAKLKYLELVRSTVTIVNLDETNEQNIPLSAILVTEEWLDERDPMWEVIAECLAHLPERCNQILTKSFIEGKDLNEILSELPTFQSKDALKTAKNKCLKRIKDNAISLYKLRAEL